MEVVEHLLYTKEHEWINIEDGYATIGISEYAQQALGDITYVELPSVGDEVEQFEEFASIESVKAATEVFSPMSGKIIEINSTLEKKPELINKSCYEKGWLVKIEVADIDERSNLMTAAEYSKFLESVDVN